MRTIKFLTMWSMLFLMSSPPVLALSCVATSVEEAYELYDAVVIGEVEQTMERENNVRELHIRVTRTYKGMEDGPVDRVEVLENATWGGGWGISAEGSEMLYFLEQSEKGWKNPLCSPTRPIQDVSSADFTFLEKAAVHGQLEKTTAQGQDTVLSESKAERSSISQASYGIIGVIVLVGIGYGVQRYAGKRRN